MAGETTTTASKATIVLADDDHRNAEGNYHPAYWILGGGFLGSIALIANIVQIQTSEAMMMGNSVTASAIPHVEILGQWLDLLSGRMSVGLIMAATVAWVMQGTAFLIASGPERVLHVLNRKRPTSHSNSLAKNSRFRQNAFYVIAIGVIIFDSAADILFSANTPIYFSFLFAIVSFFASFFVGPKAIQFIEAGIIVWLQGSR